MGGCLLWGGGCLLPGRVWGCGGVPGPGGWVSALGGVPGPGQCLVPGQGVSAPGGVCSGGCTWSFGGLLWGVYLVPGDVCCQGDVPCPGGGVPGPWGVCSGGFTWSQGMSAARGMYLVLGGVSAPGGCQVLPPVNRMTNRCKNITLPQTAFAGSNKVISSNICY